MPQLIDSRKYTRTSIFFLTLLIVSVPRAQDDLIFKSGFDLTDAQIKCPKAMELMPVNNSLGGTHYINNGAINPAGEKDYYFYSATSQEWLDIHALRDTSASANPLDPVLSIYNSDGSRLLAQSDDQAFISSQPSRNSGLIYRSINEENLCISVEDESNFNDDTPEGGPNYQYTVLVLPVDFDLYDFYNHEVEPNDSSAIAHYDLSIQFEGIRDVTRVLGDHFSEHDQDFLRITTAPHRRLMEVDIARNASSHFDGTYNVQNVEIISADGQSVLSRINPANDVNKIYLPIEDETNYYIKSDRSLEPFVDNPFYAIQIASFNYLQQRESNDALNDSFDSAEVASQSSDGGLRSAYITGRLSGDSDIDWWAFEAREDETFYLTCFSSFVGSGVKNATFSIFEDPENQPLASELENVNQGISWTDGASATGMPISISSNSTHYLSVEANLFSEEVMGRYYFCGLHLIHNDESINIENLTLFDAINYQLNDMSE